jgi:type II secretory pathway pseudopilin PulG
MKSYIPTRRPRPSSPAEEGYILVAVIFMLAIIILTLSIAAPKVAKEIQRDRELETVQRGKQYIRAIKLYYKKFGAYPPNIDALVKTNEIRFLRRRYLDPTTGKDDWKPIHFGQAKTQSTGFFGQAIAGSALAGLGPSGGNGVAGATTLGSGSTGSGSFFNSSNSATGTSTATGSTGSSTDPTAGAGGTDAGGSGISGTSTGLTGQTFGGAGIIGFSPMSPKQSILVYRKKNHYNEWEFIYDPLTDMVTVSGNAGAVGQPAGATTTPVGTSSFGQTPTATPPAQQPTQ